MCGGTIGETLAHVELFAHSSRFIIHAKCLLACMHALQLDVKNIMASAESFDEALGMSGKALLDAGLASALSDVAALASMSKAASGTE